MRATLLTDLSSTFLGLRAPSALMTLYPCRTYLCNESSHPSPTVTFRNIRSPRVPHPPSPNLVSPSKHTIRRFILPAHINGSSLHLSPIPISLCRLSLPWPHSIIHDLVPIYPVPPLLQIMILSFNLPIRYPHMFPSVHAKNRIRVYRSR